MKKTLRIATAVVTAVGGLTLLGSPAQAADGSITGTITGTGPTPLSIRVSAVDQDTFDSTEPVTVAKDGSFSIPAVGAGIVRVCFQADYGEFRERDFCTDSFTLSSGASVRVDQQYGSIAGSVSAPDEGGLADVSVDVYASEVARNGARRYVSGDRTDAEGNFRVDFVPGPGVKVYAEPETDAFAGEWFQDQASFDAATTIVPGSQAAASVAIVLDPSARLTGRVALPSGATSSDGSVTVIDPTTGEVLAREEADLSSSSKLRGTFAVTGLTAGTYKVAFGRASGVAKAPARFYRGVVETRGIGAATSVRLEPGATTTVSDKLSAADGGRVSGTVTVRKKGVRGYQLRAVDPRGLLTTRAAVTDKKGNFTVLGLSPGRYTIYVWTPGLSREKKFRTVVVKRGKATAVGKLAF